jgi:ABC-type sugar transport system substrate-binding protein
MVRKLVLAAIVCASIVVAHGQPALATSVVFVNPGKKGEAFWDMVTQTMLAAARQLGLSVEVLYAERNHRSMQGLGIEVAERATKPEFLILVNEEAAARPILAAADRNGVKTLLISNSLTGEDAQAVGAPRTSLKSWLGSVIPDMEQAGARMAHALIASARTNGLASSDGKIHLFAIGGDEVTPSSVARNRGFQQAVSSYSDVVVDRFLFANWNKADAEAVTGVYLAWAQRKGIRVAGIWAANDPMALGAMSAAVKAGLQPGKDLAVVGLNWSKEALSEVAAGRLLLTDGGHFLAGAWAMVILRDYIDGCDFSTQQTELRFATSAVSIANLASVRDLIEKQRFGEIDFRSFTASRQGRCGVYDFSLDALVSAFNSAATSN